MKILDRYLIKNFLLPLFYCLGFFSLLYIIVDIFGHLDEILRNKVPAGIILQYYTSFIPLIFVQTAPVATLLAVVYMLTTMNRYNELVAIKASGISIGRMLLPVFAIGIMLGLLLFLINESAVSKTTAAVEKIKADYIDKLPGAIKDAKTITNLTAYGKKNQMIYAKRFNPAQKRLYDIIILEHDKYQRLRRKIMAAEAVWQDNKWVFLNCLIYRFNESGQPVGNPLVFEKKIVDFTETPQRLSRYESQAGYISYRDLKDYIKRMAQADSKTLNRLKTDLYSKTALPFVCVIIMLLGVPFALSTTRGGAMADIGISITVGLLYYASIYFSLALGKGGFLPPIIAAHLSNLLFLGLGLFMFYRAPK